MMYIFSGSKMKQWLAVMIILAMEWPDVGSVETKDGMAKFFQVNQQ